MADSRVNSSCGKGSPARKTNFRRLLGLVAAGVSLYLPISRLTHEPGDPKRIVALILFPIAVLLGSRSVSLREKAKTVQRTSIVGPTLLFAFMVYVLISWYVLGYPYYGTRGLVHYWLCGAALLAGAMFISRPHIKSLFPWAAAALGTLSTLFVFTEYAALTPAHGKNGWVSGLTGNANIYGFVAITGILWCAYLISCSRSGKARLAAAGMGLFQFEGLIISQSRGSLLIVLPGLAALAILPAIKRRWYQQQAVRITGYFVVLLLGLSLAGNEGTLNRFAALWEKTVSATTAENPFAFRGALYKAQLRAFKESPLWGGGVGNFVHFTVKHWPALLRQEESPYYFARSGHNDYLEALSELGSVGFLLYVSLIVGAIARGSLRLRRRFDPLTFAFLAQLILMCLHSAYSISGRHPPSSFLLWSTAGCLWGEDYSETWSSLAHAPRRCLGAVSLGVHFLVLGLFVQILLSDYYYLRSLQQEKSRPEGALLTKALSINPNHPDALFRMAYVSVKAQKQDYALELAKHLENVAPDFRPTRFVEGYVAFQRKDYERALSMAKETLRRSKYLDARHLQMVSLSKLERCEEADRIRDSLRVESRQLQQSLLRSKEQTREEFLAAYRRNVGPIRRLVGGSALLDRHKKLARGRILERASRYEQLRRILAIPCPMDSTTGTGAGTASSVSAPATAPSASAEAKP